MSTLGQKYKWIRHCETICWYVTFCSQLCLFGSWSFICWHEKHIRIMFALLFFWFLLKPPLIDIVLLSYIQLSHEFSKNWIQHALSESHIIWICHRLCQEIGKLEWEGSHSSNQINSQFCETRNRKHDV